MLTYKIIQNDQEQTILTTSVNGKALMTIPQLNKGTAFTEKERELFGLVGKLPPLIETLEQQVERAYLQYSYYSEQINKNIYLNGILNQNQVLFYKLVKTHIEEMLPSIYTPVVGSAVKEYNERYSQPRGLYICNHDQDRIEEILENRTNTDIRLIVVSDGEGVLGIGDQGIGAMAIPVAKLMVYTLIAGINPNHTLPILLDAGTNNQKLLNDKFYLGCRHPRISGADYEQFINKFVTAVKKTFPHVFLHWEDFGRYNAYQNLAHYREKICSFNDDIQGTGVVTTAALLAATKQTKIPLTQQRIIVFGAGSAGVGISDTICQTMIHAGLTSEEAHAQFWLIDRPGLLTEHVAADATEAQKAYLRGATEVTDWKVNNTDHISLEETIANVKPTILIGTSALTGAFSQQAIETMAAHCERPVILPLSNPTERSEATPKDLLQWSRGRALIATGSPFDPVEYQGTTYPVSQCNNYLAFPGIGLGVIACRAKAVTDEMLWAASEALSEYGTINPPRLLPTIQQAEQQASRAVAIAVAKAASDAGLAGIDNNLPIEDRVDQLMWQPAYLPYQKADPDKR